MKVPMDNVLAYRSSDCACYQILIPRIQFESLENKLDQQV